MGQSPGGVRGDATAVLAQMKQRLAQGPHAALGIVEGCSPQLARTAFLQLTKTYHPAKFAREAPDVVRQANEVFLSLRAAYEAVTRASKAVAMINPPPPRSGTPTQPPQIAAPVPSTVGVPTPVRGVAAGARNISTPVRGVPGGAAATPTTARRSGPQPIIRAETPPQASTPPRGVAPKAEPSGVAKAESSATNLPRQPLARGSSQPVAGARVPAGQGTPPGTPMLRDSAPSMQPLAAGPTAPSLVTSEEADLEAAMTHLRKRSWAEARKAFHALAARVPAEKKYRALLAYARGREAQDGGRHDEARTEFTRALQLDPELNAARGALSQVAAPAPEDPPKPPARGLFSRLLKK